MICGQVEIHNGKRDMKRTSSKISAIMVEVLLHYAKTEVRFLEEVMKSSLLLFS